MANLIKQKFLEGIDSSKFKIEQGGAIKAVDASGQLVDVFKFDTVNEVVKVFGDEEVAVSSYVDSLMAQEVIDRNSAINQAITDLINGAPQALDTLKELADALAGDGDAITALINQLAQEVTDRQNGDSNLQSQVDVLDGRLDTAESDIDAEESRAMLVEQGLRSDLTQAQDDITSLEGRMSTAESDINSEESRAMLVEQGLRTDVTQAQDDITSLEGRMSQAESDINSEESRAMLVEQGLRTDLTQAQDNITSLEGRMSTAESDINSEESRAMLAEQGLRSDLTQAQDDITSLEGRMSTAESDINSEESRAMLAEQGLQNNIDVEKGRIDAILLASDADKDSFAEIVTLINSIDASNDESLAGHLVDADDAHDASAISFVNTTSGMVASNVQSALDELQSQHDDLDGYAQEVRADLDQEIIDRQAAVSAEETRAMGVEASLQSQITQEVSDRQAAVSAEETRASGVEASLQSQITQEVTDRQADVDAEETRAMAAEAALQSTLESIDTIVGGRLDALEAEDLTLFKKDGSRPMAGNILMGTNDDNGTGLANAMKWDYNSASEQTSTSYGSGFVNMTYNNADSQVAKTYLTGLEAGIQLYQSIPNVFDQDGNLQERGYAKSMGFNADILTINQDFNEVLDQDGNEISPTTTRALEVSPFKFGMQNENGTLEIRTSMFDMGGPNGSVYFQPTGYARFTGKDANDNNIETIIQSDSITTKVVSLVEYDVDGNTLAFVPTDDVHAVNKAYVDSQISGNKTFEKESFEIDSSSELSSVNLSNIAVANSMVVFVNRLALHEGVDYTVDVVSLYDEDVTRITWMGDFAVGQVEEIENGDVIHVVYMR